MFMFYLIFLLYVAVASARAIDHIEVQQHVLEACDDSRLDDTTMFMKPTLTTRPTHSPTKFLAVCSAWRNFYVLGDSYSAGINADPNGNITSSGSCSRNKGAYGYQFMEDWPSADPKDANFVFLACSGNDVADVQSTQLPQVTATPDLLTITVGGNINSAFSSVVQYCVYTYISSAYCDQKIQAALNTVSNLTTSKSLDSLFGNIRAKAPNNNGGLFVFSYVQFWPQQVDSSLCWSRTFTRSTADQKAKMNQLVLAANSLLNQTSEPHGLTYIDVDKAFEGHRFCDPGGPNNTYLQWKFFSEESEISSGDINPTADDPDLFYNKGVFHPNLAGQKAYRRRMEQVMGCPIWPTVWDKDLKLDL